MFGFYWGRAIPGKFSVMNFLQPSRMYLEFDMSIINDVVHNSSTFLIFYKFWYFFEHEFGWLHLQRGIYRVYWFLCRFLFMWNFTMMVGFFFVAWRNVYVKPFNKNVIDWEINRKRKDYKIFTSGEKVIRI